MHARRLQRRAKPRSSSAVTTRSRCRGHRMRRPTMRPSLTTRRPVPLAHGSASAAARDVDEVRPPLRPMLRDGRGRTALIRTPRSPPTNEPSLGAMRQSTSYYLRHQRPSMGSAAERSPSASPLARWCGATTIAGHAVGCSPIRAPRRSANLTPRPPSLQERGSAGLAGVLPSWPAQPALPLRAGEGPGERSSQDVGGATMATD
jgi:hypothetical protein